MLGVSAVITLAIMLFLAVSSSVNMPTAAVVPLFSVTMPTAVISVFVRTFVSVLVQTIAAPSLPVLVQATVSAFQHTVDYFFAIVLAFFPPIGNHTMSLDPSAITPPMVLYNIPAEDSDYEEGNHRINAKGLRVYLPRTDASNQRLIQTLVRRRDRQQDAIDGLDPKYLRKYPLGVEVADANFAQGVIWTPAGIAAKRAADALAAAAGGDGGGGGGGGNPPPGGPPGGGGVGGGGPSGGSGGGGGDGGGDGGGSSGGGGGGGGGGGDGEHH